MWESHIDGESVVFSRLSPDGEEGYPGAVLAQVCTHALFFPTEVLYCGIFVQHRVQILVSTPIPPPPLLPPPSSSLILDSEVFVSSQEPFAVALHPCSSLFINS